jgi:hypothetical protein
MKKNVWGEISTYIESELLYDVVHSKRWGKECKLKRFNYLSNEVK